MAARRGHPRRHRRGQPPDGGLLLGGARGVYWYGSASRSKPSQQLAPCNNATSLQVAAGVLAGMVWALRNPAAGVVGTDDLDHTLVLEIARPYLGAAAGVYGDWTPLRGHGWPFGEDVDSDDPWQFRNVRG